MVVRVGKRVRAGEGDGASQTRKLEHVLHRRRDLARRRRLLLLRSCSGRQPRAVFPFFFAQRIAERVLGRQRLGKGVRPPSSLLLAQALVDLPRPAWESTRELCYVRETSINLHAIEQTQSQGRRRVDGMGRLKLDFHTGRDSG